MDAAFAIAKVVLEPISAVLTQALEDARNFEENTTVVEKACKRLECLHGDIKSCFEAKRTVMPGFLKEWVNDVQKALEKGKQLVNNSREPQQRARNCNNWLLSKPNLSREMRECNAEFKNLIVVFNQDLCIINCVQKIVSLEHVQSSENTAGGEELQPEGGEELRSEEFAQRYKSVERDEKLPLETKNMVEIYSLYTEISYLLKPKCVAVAYVLYDQSCREILKSTMMVRKDETTNHQGYYHAIIQGLRAARSYGVNKIDVYTKDKIVYNQMQGTYKVKDENLQKLHSDADNIVKEFAACTIHHNGGEVLSVEAKQLCSDLLLQYNLRARKEIIM